MDDALRCKTIDCLEHMMKGGIGKLGDGDGALAVDQRLQGSFFWTHEDLHFGPVPALGRDVVHNVVLALTLAHHILEL